MRRIERAAKVLVTILVLGACAPSSAPQSSGSGRVAEPRAPSRALVMAVRYEPASLASMPLRESGSSVSSTTRLFNAELDHETGRGSAEPYLAEALPQLNSSLGAAAPRPPGDSSLGATAPRPPGEGGTWTVFPDGRMETSYRLRPNVTWHDGQPLAAEDFAFAYRVYTAPALAVAAGPPIDLMEEVVAADARTLTIRWRKLYPDAASLAMGFQALPRHILEQPFDRLDPDAFLSHAYWTSEYVGAGPYRLQRWEPGALLDGIAFDGHVLGRPKIDRITVRFFADENVAFTNVLAGEAQYATGRALRFEHGRGLKREWAAEQKGSVLFTPDTSRYTAVQFRTDLVAPRALLDVRVRRAIAHSVDRQALNDGIFDGDLEMSDLFLTRYSRYERLPDMEAAVSEAQRTITHYPFDGRQTEQLMSEAGFPRTDGAYVSPIGERFSFEVWSHTSPQYEKEVAILANTWQQAGFDVRPRVLPAAALRDNQLRSSFPALYIASSSRLETFASASIPTPANRWTGSDRGGWINADYDRLWGAFNATIVPNERKQAVMGMLKLLSDEVPAFVLYFNPSVSAHFAALRGPDSASPSSDVWNVHTWELR